MPHVYHAVDQLIGKPAVGSGTCVDLIKLYVPGLVGKPTSAWQEGVSVMKALEAGQKLMRGTAIATFDNGRYPQRCSVGYSGSCHHAAILLSVMPSGMWVLDQYTDPRRPNAERRFISVLPPGNQKLENGKWRNAGNNASAFSVIE